MVEVMVVMVTSSKKTYFSKLCLPGHEFEHTLGDGETGKPGALQPIWSQRAGQD